MDRSKLEWPLRALGTVALFAAVGLYGCASTPTQKSGWPTEDVVPAETPDDLETGAAASVLRRGSDGYLYAVGGVPGGAEPGTPFVARYSGDWPLEEVERPPLAAGRVVRTVGEDVAVVHLTYQLPDTDIEGLEISWEEKIYSEPIGKGIGQVESVDGGEVTSAELTIGEESGVEAGDVYALLSGPSRISSPVDAQLSRRFRAICYVSETSKSTSRCRVRGSGDSIRRADEALFLEHVLDKPPRKGIIQIAGLSDAASNAAASARESLQSAFRSFAADRSEAKVEIRSVDRALEASRADFHRVESKLDYTGHPQLVVGAEAVEGEKGKTRLVVNYTGVGPATGAGMVAAPPTGGVDLGPVDAMDRSELRAFVSIVWSGMLVYRGQNARALAFLHDQLSGPIDDGPLRWHARDQYAMRWGALGHYGESIWLASQDRAVAEKKYGTPARLNAEGTLVRLYDFVGQTARAVEEARRYLKEQERKKPGTEWLAAVGMLAELQAANGDVEGARKSVETLQEACADGCGGDLFSYLSSVWWATGDVDAESFADDLLSSLLEIGKRDRGRRLAAARLYQGLQAMRDEEADQALIGFLESARLYESLDHLVGLARARYFQMIAEVQREERQRAFDAGQKAVELRRKLRDFDGLARTYGRLSSVFANVDLQKRPGQYLRSARSVLTKSYESQRATGSFGEAGQSLYTLGSFLFKFGQQQSARTLLRKAVGFSVSATRFDIAALSHLYLAIIAKQNERQNEFQNEAERARTMAELSGSARIKQMVDRALDPDRERKEDDPTQML